MGQDGLFQFSIEKALEMLLIFDGSGKIVYANQSARQSLGYGNELCENSMVNVFPGVFYLGNDGVVFDGTIGEVLQNVMAYRKNKTCFPVRARVFIYEQMQEGLGEDNYKAPMYVWSAINASTENFLEKKASQAGQAAEQALKVKSEFVANVTHELRTPVNGILGNIRELLNLETESSKLKLLQLVERGCCDMNSIINNILDFSKLEAGKFTLENRQFNFRSMIEYVKGNHSNRIIEKGLDFSINVSPDIPENVISDELRIVQILNNLISNAYKFTSVGEIHVEVVKTAQSDKMIELFFMVMDTGIGIAKADQDKLFKSFSQVDTSIYRKYGGTGLGLNISKQLVELLGGSIHVDSNVGKGTTFSFHIWVEVPENYHNVKKCAVSREERELLHKLQAPIVSRINEKIWKYGEPENREELEKKMSKLILSMEMDNWEKAEMFTESVKQLLEEAPKEVKNAALKLKMSVQRGEYDKAVNAFEKLQIMI